MGKLDEVLNVFCDSKKDVFANNAKEEDIQELKELLKNEIRQNIIDEIVAEQSKEIAIKAQKELDRSEEDKRIGETKNLLWNGFIMAFIVGVLVNQVTDIISFYKGGSSLKTISPTVWICVILAIFCLGMYIYTFAQNFIKIVKNRYD